MKKINELDLNDKTVIVRVDYNVPIKDGIVTDDNRIRQSLKTLDYLIEKKCKIILLSHLGKIKEEADKEKNTLKPVKEVLEKLINRNVKFSSSLRGDELETKIKNLNNGEILLVENTRYLDYPNKLESNCDEELSKYWASLADVFIMDAFGSAHRAHASTVGIAKYLPSAAGYLVIKELEELEKIKSTEKTLLLGGAKVSDKIGVIDNLITTNTYVDDEKLLYAKKLLEDYKSKIILPIDVVTENGNKEIHKITENETILDIGNNTIELFKKHLSNSKLVLTNGTMGLYEDEKYENGTKNILQFLSQNSIKTIVCGGDTASAAKKYKCDFYYISTGGGASLEYLSGEKLPGIEVLGE